MSPTRVLYIDATQGAAGDMILGALVDLGVPLAVVRRALASLPLGGYALATRAIERAGLRATKLDVRLRGEHHGRSWREIERIVRGGALAAPIVERALAIFRRLVQAEAEVHGVGQRHVHLHEVGDTDAIVDVVGAAVAIEHLAPAAIVVSPLTTGFGEVRCAHGVYHVPAPATALLVRGAPVRGGTIEGERLTPTGAAILTTIAGGWGAMPPMVPRAVGYGAGDREMGLVANVVRAVLGDAVSAASEPEAEIVVIECTLDDATPQHVAWAAERMLELGALDVMTSAVTMKKGRAGHALTVLARPAELGTLAAALLRDTPTLGVRYRREQRIELPRSVVGVATPYGRIPVKLAAAPGDARKAWPEYDACARAAAAHGVGLWDVQRAALAALGSVRAPVRAARRAAGRSPATVDRASARVRGRRR
jgi:uncharacterized protein (TIGR00299 family) protein